MREFRYIDGVVSLALDENVCIGCGMCTVVCPHSVFRMQGTKVQVVDHDGCMECGACAMNCPVQAIAVTPGVGCAAYVIGRWLHQLGLVKKPGGCCT